MASKGESLASFLAGIHDDTVIVKKVNRSAEQGRKQGEEDAFLNENGSDLSGRDPCAF